MIYLDNAATTFPKPQIVKNTMNFAVSNLGGNPGRSGHSLSINSAKSIFKTREVVADFFNFSKPENVIFTPNCTFALNCALKGALKGKKGNIIISCLEHNSLARPAYALSEEGLISVKIADVSFDNEQTIKNFEDLIDDNTLMIAVTHASNLTGQILPIEELSVLCKKYGIMLLVDAAQTAGIVPIDLSKTDIDFLCMPGHKGLYGPFGSGVLIVKDEEKISPIIEGGTGSGSFLLKQVDEMPDKLESGTLNTIAINGLKSGILFVNNKGIGKIAKHEILLISYLYKNLINMNNIKLYSNEPKLSSSVGTLCFNIDGHHSEEVASILNNNKIATRGGFHCAGLAHKKIKTENTGAIRVSVSIFNTKDDIDALVRVIKKI